MGSDRSISRTGAFSLSPVCRGSWRAFSNGANAGASRVPVIGLGANSWHVFNQTIKYVPRYRRTREEKKLCGRDLRPASRQVFDRDEEMLAALALKTIVLHVVGEVGMF